MDILNMFHELKARHKAERETLFSNHYAAYLYVGENSGNVKSQNGVTLIEYTDDEYLNIFVVSENLQSLIDFCKKFSGDGSVPEIRKGKTIAYNELK